MSRTCPECYGTIINEGAHWEACPGPMVFIGYQCARCLAVTQSGERQCFCGGLKHPAYAKPISERDKKLDELTELSEDYEGGYS